MSSGGQPNVGSRRQRGWDEIVIIITIITVIIVIIATIYLAFSDSPNNTRQGPSIEVESDSMQHNDRGGKIGIIDKGDIVYYNEINDKNDVKSYFEGKRNNYQKYGEYGDVIIYYKNGYEDITPVIHRALIWLEYNESGNSFDIPELKFHESGEDGEWYIVGDEDRWYNLRGTLVLKNVGYDEMDISINLNNILINYNNPEIEPHSGFVTLGDQNGANCDQNMLRDDHGGIVEPVKSEWIAGKVTHLVDK
jgi:signal peptidase